MTPAILILLAVAFLSACRAESAAVGSEGRVPAVYWQGTLWADLPAALRVPAVAAAADLGLRDRGYAVSSLRATEDAAHLTAQPPDPALFESVLVRVRLVQDATQVGVTVRPWGDHPASRAILDAILARLGL